MTLETVRAELQALAEPDYAAFSARLLPGAKGILGVRLPKLRALAGQYAAEGKPLLKALDGASPESFEETMLYGMLVGAVKMPDEERLFWMERFVPRIENWSVCDSFCAGCKAPGKNRPFYRDFIERLLGGGKEYPVRCGLVLLLDWYLTPEEIDWVLQKLREFSHPGYYARMAAAWCGSAAYIRFPEKTEAFLREGTLDRFTHNKLIQKACESRRVTDKARTRLRALKR